MYGWNCKYQNFENITQEKWLHLVTSCVSTNPGFQSWFEMLCQCKNFKFIVIKILLYV